MSSDTKLDQIQIIKWSEASEVETRSRKSNSEQNSNTLVASEQEYAIEVLTLNNRCLTPETLSAIWRNPSELKRD